MATLLAQTGLSGDEIREAVRTGAVQDATTLADPDAYGAGRLSAAGALGVASDAAPPAVSVTADAAQVGEPVTLHLSLSDPQYESSTLVARWDDGYDGSWDTEYVSDVERVVQHAEVGRYPYKVRARNPSGRVAESVFWLEVVDAPVQQPDAGAPDAGGTPVGATPKASEDDGCGCRFGTKPTGAGLGSLVALLALAWARRRR